MRTLKKALCMVLVLSMLFSLGIFSASALEFTDGDDIAYAEAAEVLTTIGVIEGFEDGSFRPTETLTRAQGAAITARLMNWQDVPAISEFTDVPAWAHPYVAFCEANGIVAGYGDGRFGPDDPLTGGQFAKMVLGALNYDPEIEGMQNVGTMWIIKVAQYAKQNGLDAGIEEFPYNEPINREQAMQVALNAIKAKMVEYTTTSSSIAATANASYMTSTVASEQTISREHLTNANYIYTVELGEYYFPALRLDDTDSDAFMRPAVTWTYRSQLIGTYAEEPSLVYEDFVTLGTIYNDLSLTKGIPASNITAYQDGVEISWANDIVRGLTTGIGGKSVKVEVYYDDIDNTAEIVIIDNFVGSVATVYAASSTKNAYVTVKFTTDLADALDEVDEDTLKNTFETTDLAKSDVVYYTYSMKSGENRIVTLEKADKVDGDVSRYTEHTLGVNGGSVTAGGTAYDIAKYAPDAKGLNLDKTIGVYTDDYGNAILVEGDTSSEYAVLIGYDPGNSLDSARVKLILADGSVVTVPTSTKFKVVGPGYTDFKTDGTKYICCKGESGSGDEELTISNYTQVFSLYDIVTYTPGSSYAIGEVIADSTQAAKQTILPGKNLLEMNGDNSQTTYNVRQDTVYSLMADTTTWQNDITADGDTIFILQNAKGGVTIYEGIGNVPKIEIAGASGEYYTVYVDQSKNTDSKVATIVYLKHGSNTEVKNPDSTKLYILGAGVGETHVKEGGLDYWEYKGFQDGEEVTVQIDKQVKFPTLITNPTRDKNGIITGYATSASYAKSASHDADLVEVLTPDDNSETFWAEGVNSFKNNVAVFGDSAYSIASDAKIYYINIDNEISEIAASSIVVDENDQVWWHMNEYFADVVYIKAVDEASSASGTDNYKYEWVNDDGVLVLTITNKDNNTGEGYKYTVYSYAIRDTTASAVKVSASSGNTGIVGTPREVLATSSADNVYFVVAETTSGAIISTDTIAGGSTPGGVA